MPIEIILPSLSAGMEDAVIAEWLKAEGDTVARGDVLAEVETDKATMELEAEAEGTVGKLIVAKGTRANVGEVIAVLLAESEITTPAPITAERASRLSASPLARRIAAEKGIELTALTGSGPRGRIVRTDIERAAARGTAAAPTVVTAPPASGIPAGIGEYDAIPLSSVRRVIARRLLEAKTTIPHFYLEADCDLEAVLDLRAQINEGREKADKISVNDFIIKAVAHAMRKVPATNAIWTDEAVLQLRSVDISVAVATENGLITPVVREVDHKTIRAISTEIKELAGRARNGKLKPEEYQGGGFSVSNLGMFGVKSFAAIINPPQSCILAVGAAEERPVGRNGQIVLAPMMSCTLSVDHRSVDGAVGAEWLAAFKVAIEAPITLLV